MSIDALIFAPWILTVEEETPLLKNHALAIKNNKIHTILTASDAEEIAKNLNPQQIFRLNQHILMPGLINLHGHSAMTLLRGYADDLALMDWLENHIWPAEGKYANADFVYDGCCIAMAEMIRGGTTSINDMYFHHTEVGKAAVDMNMRTYVGCSILEFPTPFAQNAQEYLDKAVHAYQNFKHHPLVTFTLAPHAPYTVSDDTFKKVAKLRDQYDFLVHCHIQETQFEVNESMKLHQMRPIERLEKLGLLDNQLIAAHAVHTSDTDIKLLAKHQVHVAHNPASNMKLASGFARIQDMLNAGINVGLGTDGAASNNRLDMLADMRLAALIAKGFSGNPTDIKALDAIKMATINGAKALNQEQNLGSLKEGKLADIIAINLLDHIETMPIFDPISHIAYSAGREQVSHVWINGELLLKEHQFTKIKPKDIKALAEKWQNKLTK